MGFHKMANVYIYKITNTVNGKLYIGQTCDMKMRMRHYRSASNVKPKHRTAITDAMYKYGFDAFTFEVIDTGKNEEEGNELEMQYIAEYDTFDTDLGYNSSPGGDGRRRGSKTNFRHTTEEKLKRSKAIIVYRDCVFHVYTSAKEFASEMGCDRSIISAAMRKGVKYKRHLFYYYDDDKRNEFLNKLSHKKRYREIGEAINDIGVEDIDEAIFVTEELSDFERY